MSYIIVFSREDEKIFKGMRTLLQDLRSRTGTPSGLILELEKELGIKLERQYHIGSPNTWKLTFPDEQAYVWFMLRWA